MQKVEAHHLRWLHLAAMVVWALLLVPTLIWWRDSIVWIVTMSWYANFVGHWSAWQAARSEEAAPSPGGSDSDPGGH